MTYQIRVEGELGVPLVSVNRIDDRRFS